MANLDDLKAKMERALADNDTSEIVAISKQIKALDDEARKAEREAVSKDYDELATELSAALRDALKPFWKRMEKVGLTKRVYIALEGKTVSIPSQARGGGGGGGGAGKTKAEYGMSLAEIAELYQADALAAGAITPDDVADLAGGDGNAKYSAKVKVKKWALAEGHLTPES